MYLLQAFSLNFPFTLYLVMLLIVSNKDELEAKQMIEFANVA